MWGLPNFWAKVAAIVKRAPKPVVSGPVTMYDSVTPAMIPSTAKAVAGYVGGEWPNFDQLVKEFPDAKHLSVAVNATEDAECLDVEAGDATNDQVVEWVKRQVARGVKVPVVYTQVSNVAALDQALNKGGLSRKSIRLWTAHYTGKEHLCSAVCGFGMVGTADATQWTNHGLDRNLDVSICSSSFFA